MIAQSVVKKLTKKKATLSVAESITGGGLASAITEVPGSSKVFVGGVIAYADLVKVSELKVDGKTLFYYSNIFATDYMIKHHMWSEIDQKYNEALGIFSQKPDVILYGTDSLSRWKVSKI